MNYFDVGNRDVKKVKIGLNRDLVFIGGPCAIESERHAIFMADKINKICNKLKIPWIYKSCFNKDCRSSENSFHGVGIEKGLDILCKVRKKFKVPIVSDFSIPDWAEDVGKVCDMIQIPAYLCRQTSILKAAAKTMKPINLKKGQFMSPWNMKNSVRKIENEGNKKILLTDRGTFFGYNMLVNDMTSLSIMSKLNYPVCFDATHSVQLPTSMGNISGGQREFIPGLVRAAVASGIQALFMEVHDNPPKALSDSNTVLNLKYLYEVLYQAKIIHKIRRNIYKKFGSDKVHIND
jgi:2-dehydro-3-deoxyphosphooctonate aldolase (KDO 8-P synthase)